MTSIEVTVKLHTPARIATGRAARGLDAVLDREIIPASSLKGIMRATGREILGLSEPTLGRLFGTATGQASAWAWSDIELPSAAVVGTRVRIPIDPATGVARTGGLLHAEELWVDEPMHFTIQQISAASESDACLLAACAMAVKGLGASRRRGLGWVTMTAQIAGRQVGAVEAASLVETERAGQ